MKAPIRYAGFVIVSAAVSLLLGSFVERQISHDEVTGTLERLNVQYAEQKKITATRLDEITEKLSEIDKKVQEIADKGRR